MECQISNCVSKNPSLLQTSFIVRSTKILCYFIFASFSETGARLGLHITTQRQYSYCEVAVCETVILHIQQWNLRIFELSTKVISSLKGRVRARFYFWIYPDYTIPCRLHCLGFDYSTLRESAIIKKTLKNIHKFRRTCRCGKENKRGERLMSGTASKCFGTLRRVYNI